MMTDLLNRDLIVTIVKKGWCEKIIKASTAAGAEGATIIPARGTGIHEQKHLLGIPIEPEKDLILTIVPEEITDRVLDAIIEAGKLYKPATGIVFVLDLKKVAGIVHQVRALEEIKKQIKE
jgi:nitrogen regulatory protein P-II 1